MPNAKSQMGPKTGKWIVTENGRGLYDVLEPHLGYCNVIAQHLDENTAKFIVKACNLHDELVEGLKLALTLNGNPRRDSEDNAEWDKVIDNIKNLIAKAQEA